jgi:glc operon protein GlcG
MAETDGSPIGVDSAKKAIAAALAEAKKNGWTMAAAVVDLGGHLVAFERMDGTQTGSAAVCVDKARSAALFRRPTKVFQDAIAAGGEGLRFLKLRGAIPIEGGVPLAVGGRIVGALGLSGGASPEDGQCARAGASALAP